MKGLKIVVMLAAAIAMLGSSLQAQEKKDQIVPEANIKETKIIRLHYAGGITPEVLKVKPGTTVVWVNDSRAMLEIQFEGKQVTLACKSPVHFNIDEEGSFISDRIPQDAVASLCFVEKGEFNYVARKAAASTADQPRSSIKEFKGKIIVE